MADKKFILLLVLISFSLISLNFVSSYCWSQTTESACVLDTDESCIWKNDGYGSWCEVLSCWSLYNQTDCETTVLTGKNCSWSGGSTYHSCEDVGCWSFDGTNESYCVNNSAGLGCKWYSDCYGWTSSGVDCWSLSTEAQCKNITGCMWGSCGTKSCYDYTATSTCQAAKDWNGNNCTWDSSGSYCTENGCWKYYNQTDCDAVVNLDDLDDNDCIWKWGYCQNIGCWTWDGTNSTTCLNNTANLSCNWDGQWCMAQSCWAYGETDCLTHGDCVWKSYSSGGWCEEVQCWLWDGWKGGNETACADNDYGLGCIWEYGFDGSNATGWCYQDYTTTSNCSNFTTERQCMDTYWCWWEYINWASPELGGDCKDPNWGGTGYSDTAVFNVWNPGCYIFDMNMSKCGMVLGCDNTTYADQCIMNVTHPNNISIENQGINCTMVNDSSLCNNVPMLATCCSWQNSSCSENKMTTSCWDQMESPPEGASFCEDYRSYTDYTLCVQIAGDPWYMPCEWNNATERCGFKSIDVFGNTSMSLSKIDNKKNCESAGGKWVLEWYCEGNRSVSAGRCEYKCDDETNCDKACFACENYDSSGNAVNSSNANDACIGSALGYCGFTADTSAPNGIGYCKAREQFKKGVATDCDTDCGSCTYMGDTVTNDTTKKPSYYCQFSKANSVGGGCKWTTDNTTTQGGYCINKGEITCEDTCDRCSTQEKCVTDGAKNKRNITFENSSACEWDSANEICTKSGEKSEICWDGIDNNGDNLIDCADSGCYSDTFCGFVEGNCFIWTDNETCINNDCEWVKDNWGAWCDFKGSSCWKNNWNMTSCDLEKYCEWHNDTWSGSFGWCEQDWSIGDACMGQNYDDCAAKTASNNCTWTNDTWCSQYPNNETSWCGDFGGWCDYAPFAPKNCWLYDTNKTSCWGASGCNWTVGGWFEPYCSIDYNSNCWNYYGQSDCESGGCRWKNETWGSYCSHNSSYCWSESTNAGCIAVTDFDCTWNDWGNYCEASCWNSTSSNSSSGCTSSSGCIWVEESGWCSEIYVDQITCWNATNTNDEDLCNDASGCRWKTPGWCDPVGFSGGGVAEAYGFGGGGDSCYKYDGNKTLCTNSSIINMSCGWMDAYDPFCSVDWNMDCWNYNDNTTCVTAGCYWFNGTDDSGENGELNNYCMNPSDICWKNESLRYDETKCNTNPQCNWTDWGTCDSVCFNSNQATKDSCRASANCTWVDGWCSPAGTVDMFSEMQEGQHVELGTDSCGGGADSVVDICGFGIKDMGNAYGFGIRVENFDNASVCNKEKLTGGEFGSGNRTVKFYYYLDMDGNSSGGCKLVHDSSLEGYEFRFDYESEWNSTLSKSKEIVTSFKCKNNNWEGTDIKLTTMETKMCSEIGGSFVAVEKSDLEKFPTLYDSTKDIRILVASANETTNISSPADTASPGWTSPGAVDFEISDMFSYGADSAKFEESLRKCYVSFEDCYNGVDDDDDGLIDCNDYDCTYSSKCNLTGVNVLTFVDTSTPRLIGAKVEEYYDSALIMYDTTKPANGTLYFYYNDSTCKTLNATIYDAGILKNNSVREFRTSHLAHIFNDSGATSLDYNLTNQTTYYYKLKVCDEDGRCGQSKCSSFTTSSADNCGYCNFVTRIQTPDGWDVNYDLDQDGTYEHVQGKVCGPTAGMRTNYTTGRKVNIKLNRTDGTSYIIFYNATLTKTGLNSKTRNITSINAFNNGSITNADGNIVGYVGMVSETRDKIVYNLYPERCEIKIPGMIDELWHCPDNLSSEDCVNKTDEATLLNTNNVSTGWREWEIPFCEFSTWSGGKPTAAAASTPSSGSSGGGGSSSVVETKTWSKTIILTEEQFKEGVTKQLAKSERIKFSLLGISHYIGVNRLDSKTATLEIASSPVEATLSIGDERRFDVTGDGFYDVQVTLNSIKDNKADLIVKSIYEEVTEEAEKLEKEKEEIAKKQVEKEKSFIWVWVWGGILLASIIALILIFLRSYKKKKRFF